MKRFVVAAVVAVQVTILVLGLISLNFYHHIVLPDVMFKTHIIKTSFYNTSYPFIHHEVDIQLSQEIKGYDSIHRVEQELQGASKGDLIKFHLTGYGGEVNTVLALINNIKASNALVEMDVEAPVYSGHAYLALSGDRLVMSNNSYLMLHTSSGMNEDCSAATGSDRAETNIVHCENMKKADFLIINSIISNLPILTAEEKVSVMLGHDLYLDSSVVKARQDAK
jgi:ATP-dependent protease ClpP protease subunit